MGYYEFPHTRNYDKDLGFLIKRYKELIKDYENLINVYQRLIDAINDVVRELFEEGKILLDCQYNENEEIISFVFSCVEENKGVLETILDEGGIQYNE